VSELRIEKRRVDAVLVLATGSRVGGCFFVADSSPTHAPERVVDLLNGESGFFPFELNADAGAHTVLYNRAQLVLVTLKEEGTAEVTLDPGYDVATTRRVRMVLSTGAVVEGVVRIYRPAGRDRLSDYYGRSPEAFRYVETASATVIVNLSHIVELRETTEA
jgi:hypothetical protein